jgi:hypothetical protein
MEDRMITQRDLPIAAGRVRLLCWNEVGHEVYNGKLMSYCDAERADGRKQGGTATFSSR